MKKIIFLLILGLVLTPQLAFATEGTGANEIAPHDVSTTDVSSAPAPSAMVGKHNGEFMQAKQQYLQQKEEAMKNLQTKHEEMRANIANLQPTIEAERAMMKEKFQQERDAFKLQISQLKDTRKKTIAERVDTNLAAINKRRTDQMTENLNKLSTILTKIKTKRDSLAASGKDVTSLNSTISTAEAAISAAQAAVAAQAGKDYTANVTDPTTLKTALDTVRKQLESDLLATHKTVVDAKSAVLAAAKALWTLSGGPTPEAPSPTVAVTVEPTAVPTQ